MKTSSAQDFQITPIQLKQTNILFNQLEELEIQDSLDIEIFNHYNELLNQYEETSILNKNLISELNNQLNIMNDSIINAKKSIQKVTKQRNIVTYWAGGSTGLCLILLILLI